ncbi:MAG: BMP family ABC transporter substrate-binding protein [Acidimicrobiaceae bacterium]|nr:BMP family ABC transporter substrate-binding protein [Acidimicrobiaceae bacterium]
MSTRFFREHLRAVFAAVAAVAGLVFVAAACGDDAEDAAAPAAPAVDTEAVEAAEAEADTARAEADAARAEADAAAAAAAEAAAALEAADADAAVSDEEMAELEAQLAAAEEAASAAESRASEAEAAAEEAEMVVESMAVAGAMTVLPEMTSVSIQTDWFPSTDHAALYAADLLGFFEERNLDVEIRPGGPGIRAANDVVTGNVTFGMAIPENVVLASAGGADLVTFFATYQQSPIGFMVHASSGASGLDDLAQVQVFPGQVFWEVLKRENNLQVEEIAFDGSLVAWGENEGWAVQAFATTSPHFARLAGADPVMLTATSLGFRSYATTLFTSDDYAASNPDVVRAFTEAAQAGLEAFLDDPGPVIAHINEIWPDFDISVGEAAYDVMTELVVSDATEQLGLGAMDGTVWGGVAGRMFDAGVISTAVNSADLWTNAFLPGGTGVDMTGFRWVMVTDQAGLGDEGFNDLAWAGISQAASELGGSGDVIESSEQAQYVPNLQQSVDAGANLTVGVGFLITDAIEEVAEANPDSNFVLIDAVADSGRGFDPGDPLPNVQSVLYAEHEAAYLAGIIAGMTTQADILAYVGGIEIPPTVRFLSGFQQGVASVNAAAEVTVSWVGAFDDPTTGRELSSAAYDDGADIVFEVAGLSGLGAYEEAKDRGAGHWVIGTDTCKDQLAPDNYLTSATKDVAGSVFRAAQQVANGTFAGGVSVLDLKGGYVGVCEKTFGDLSAEIQDAVNAAVDGIRSGSITVDPGV